MKKLFLALSLLIAALTGFSSASHAAPLSISAVGLGLGGGDDDILGPDEAFKLTTSVENGQLKAHWEIADGHYMYRDKIKLSLLDADGIESGTITIPQGEMKNDEFFGKIYVFHHAADAAMAYTNTSGTDKTATFKIRYQGCSEVSGICYPPITKKIPVTLPVATASAATSTSAEPTTEASPPASADTYVSEQDQIASTLKEGSTWVILITFFGFGLLLAFTPCVFPMIPILSSIIVGHGKEITTRHAFTMSTVYVLAMAITYTAAGVIAGLFGENLQAAFQNPWILGTFSGVFVLLSLSMFGFYDLQLPNSWQSKLTTISNQQKGGSLGGVAIMGFLSALIVGPCVAAPLAGALIYIGQTGDAVLGGLALFSLSMGMGAPLIAIGTSAGKLLPRAGGWMDSVKSVFGVMLLAVAIWMLERIIPAAVSMTMWALLLILSAIYMKALDPLDHGISGWYRFWKGIGIFMLAYGILILIGVASGSNDVFQPLKNIAVAGTSHQSTQQSAHLNFKKIKGVDGLNAALAEAKAAGKPVMLDFYADWCVSCKEMEKLTFVDAEVQQKLSNFVLLQADVTPNDEKDQALYKHFNIIGPPAIIFYDTQGTERRNLRVVGYMPAKEFAGIIGRV